jgi:O-antigen ligase
LTDLSVTETLFVLLLFSLPFEQGLRGGDIVVVPPGPELWMPGYSFYFGFNLKLIFSLALFLLIIFDKKTNFKHLSFSHWLMLAFFSLSIISTFLAPDFYLALSGLIRIASIVWLYFLATQFLRKKRIQSYFQQLVIAFLLFFGIIGTVQFISQQPLGLFLEESLALEKYGYITTEGGFINRVSGLIGHPTFFASFLSLLVPIGLGISLHLIEKKMVNSLYFVISALACFLSLISVFGSFSRSGWLALALSIPFFIWQIQKRNKIRKLHLTTSIVAPVVLLILVFSPLFISRIASIEHIWTLGSGRVRLDLIQQAWLMIKDYPLFGVGLNHFTRVMNTQTSSPELIGFMYPVHNTFFLFFSELGILAGLIFIILIARELYRTFKKNLNNWINIGIWFGAFTFLINAQFHTLFNQDSTLELFVVLLAYLSLL